MRISPARLIAIREGLGWRQSDLAREAGLSQSYLSLIEAGTREPSPLVVQTLATRLGVAVADIRSGLRCPYCGRVIDQGHHRDDDAQPSHWSGARPPDALDT